MASAWGTSWGTSWASSWDGSGTVADPIGRKRRRGITRPRRQELPEAIAEIRQERDETQDWLVEARADLQSALAKSADRSAQIEQLTARVNALEFDLRRIKDEEEMLMLLAFAVMEM